MLVAYDDHKPPPCGRNVHVYLLDDLSIHEDATIKS